MGYFAQLDGATVSRVVVCNDIEWLETRLGGEWVETADPEAVGDLAYTGPGQGYDPQFPERFAPQWVMPIALEDGTWSWYAQGQRTFHNGRIWRSGVNENVWEPGSAAWFDAPPGGRPTWFQPTGSSDAFPALDPETLESMIVKHNDKFWLNTHGDGNVWEPGGVGIGPSIWREVNEDGTEIEPDPGEVIDWEVGQNVVVNDERRHNGVMYRCLVAHTTHAGWEPGPATWSVWEVQP